MTKGYLVYCAIQGTQLALLAMATDSLGGHSGRMGVSSVLFAATAGYGYALLAGRAGINPWLCVFLVTCISAFIGIVVGWLFLHLKEKDFLLATIAAQVGFVQLANNTELLGASLGLGNIPAPLFGRMTADPALNAAWLLLLAGVLFGAILSFVLNAKSRYSRAIHWIRDDAVSARAFGLSIEKWRLFLFLPHAAMSATVGISMVVVQGYVSPASFELWLSIQVLTVVYLSGTGGHPLSMFAGGAILVIISELLRSFGRFPDLVGPAQQITTNAILIGILVMRRRGLAGPILEIGPSATRLE